MSHLFAVSGGPGRSIAARCISAVALAVWISPVTVAALTYRQGVALPASIVIALIAVVWTVQRLYLALD